MTECTDRHCRSLHRLPSRHTRLHTEVVTTGAVLHGDVPRHLAFNEQEHPVALQLGGSEPDGIAMMRDADKLAVTLGLAADQRVREANSSADARAHKAGTAFQAVLWGVGAVLLVAVAVAAGVALWVARAPLGSVAQASAAASRLARGDLTVELRGHSRDEIGDLLDALGQAVQSVSGALGLVSDSATSIHAASSEVSSGNHDLSARTE